MAIQGTQIPIYTKHTLFLYVSDFSIFLLNFYMKNKTKQNWEKNKNMLNKAKHKTSVTQNLKVKHTSNAHTKSRREKEKSDRITWSPFPSTPWKNLSFD